MKRTFKKIISFICLLTLILSVSGCSQFVDLNVGSGVYQELSVTMQLKKQMIFCDTGETPAKVEDPISVGFFVENSTQELSTEEAAQKVMRSVVLIKIKTPEGTLGGSGVIVNIKGGLGANEYYILTCHHVISSGGEITVCVPDGEGRNYGDVGYDEKYIFTGYIGKGKEVDKENSVCLVGGDKDGDIALLKLKVGNRPVDIVMASFANPNLIEVSYAQEVFAIGNPAGRLPMTYMHGYISYLDRTGTFDSIGMMTNLIQHDCLITHGNSGGGLFNMKGQLIGITNGGIESSPGISYAIPYYNTYYDINEGYYKSNEYGFMYIASQLIKTDNELNYGYVQGRWELGVTVSDAESAVSGSKLIIKDVSLGSNADGLIQKGDYITEMEFLGTKYPITSMSTFVNAIFIAREYLQSSSVIDNADEIKFTIQRAK